MSRFRTVQLYTVFATLWCLLVVVAFFGTPVSFLGLLGLAATAYKFWPSFFGSWYIGLNPAVQKRLFSLIPKGEGKTFYDIGSGDGRVVIEAARRGCIAKGVELDPVKYFLSKARVRKQRNAQFTWGNFFHQRYGDADVVFMWLPQETIHRLETKLLREMKRGSVIITHEFPLHNIAPYVTDADAQLYAHRVQMRGFVRSARSARSARSKLKTRSSE